MPSHAAEHRKLAAIMFTDMVGYSALAQRNESLALELLEEHRRLLRPIFPQFNGREVETAGDAFLVEFASALEATHCAVEIQRLLPERNQLQPAERHIRLRIGIHVGDVVHKDGKVMGDAVNIAARIEPLAEPGGICISNAVYEQVRNKVELPLVRFGEPELKNIEVPVVVYKVVLKGDATIDLKIREAVRVTEPTPENILRNRWRMAFATGVFVLVAVNAFLFLRFGWRSGSSTPTSKGQAAASNEVVKSIAVLPFVNMSADKDNEYFSDGITEEILNALARTPGLRVAARTSAFSFKGKNESVQRIGEALKVGAILEGSVRRAGNQLRITAQLINVADGFHLWSDTFDRKAEDVFAIQTEVAQRVQEALKVKLLAGTSPNTALAGTDNLEAYDLYLRGRELWSKRTAVDLQRAIGYFEQATSKDTKFALAYVGMANCYVLLPEYANTKPREVIPKARVAATRALELDNKLAETYTVLAYIKEYFDRDWRDAEKGFKRSISLNPNYATAHQWYAELLTFQGRFDEATIHLRQAQVLDPLSPIIQVNIAVTLYCQRRFDEALAELRKTLELAPNFLVALQVRGWVYLAQGKLSDAINELQTSRKLAGPIPSGLGALGNAYARAGRTDEARQVLKQLENFSSQGAAVAYEIASVHLGFGDKDETFVWLERVAEEEVWDLRMLMVDPLWTEACADARFAALLKKFGLDK